MPEEYSQAPMLKMSFVGQMMNPEDYPQEFDWMAPGDFS